MKPKIDQLIAFEVFKGFSPAELGAVANSLDVIELGENDVLFEQGASGRSMFYIYRGAVRIEGNGGVVYATLESPTILGEMAILEHKPRSARAVADKESVLWEMDESSLAKLVEQSNMAAYKIMKWIATGLSDKLRKMNDTVNQLNQKIISQSRRAEWEG